MLPGLHVGGKVQLGFFFFGGGGTSHIPQMEASCNAFIPFYFHSIRLHFLPFHFPSFHLR